MYISSEQLKLCDCTQGIDDLQHFFFDCKNYETIRHDIIEWVQSVLTLVDQHKRPNLSTSLLLAPSGYKQINVKNCSLYTVLTATDQKPQKS